MEKKRCGYCGRFWDIDLFQALDNGSEACPDCVAYEDKMLEEKGEGEKWERDSALFC